MEIRRFGELTCVCEHKLVRVILVQIHHRLLPQDRAMSRYTILILI